MTAATNTLRDDAARRTAIGVHDRSILVEAGAGSGKTAVMAGRIAAMLAEGIAPKSIAAVTFTELAASELLIRVRDFVADLAAGTVPTELRIAFPDGLSANHSANLAAAASVSFDIAGKPTVVMDWKSDVQPTAETLNHYRAQVRAYLDMTGTDRGLIVLVTTGQVIAVTPTTAPLAA